MEFFRLKKLKIIKISVGFSHSLVLTGNLNFLTIDQGLFSFGSNEYLQLGVEKKHSYLPHHVKFDGKIENIFSGGYHNMFITDEGKLYGFGRNENGELGLSLKKNTLITHLDHSFENIKHVILGYNFSYLFSKNNSLGAYGNNDNNQLDFSYLYMRSSCGMDINCPLSFKDFQELDFDSSNIYILIFRDL